MGFNYYFFARKCMKVADIIYDLCYRKTISFSCEHSEYLRKYSQSWRFETNFATQSEKPVNGRRKMHCNLIKNVYNTIGILLTKR